MVRREWGLWGAAALLVAAFHLPAEESWSPLRMAFGYSLGGTLVSGPDVAVVEAGPYWVGVVLLLGRGIQRRAG